MASWNLFSKNTQNDSKGKDVMSDAVTIDLGEMLDISFAAKLHAQLKDEAENKKNIKFVSAGLNRIDASCLQVLVGFMSYAKEHGINIHWESPGEIITESARLLGLTDNLQFNN